VRASNVVTSHADAHCRRARTRAPLLRPGSRSKFALRRAPTAVAYSDPSALSEVLWQSDRRTDEKERWRRSDYGPPGACDPSKGEHP
jgi:hypothetical protein